MALEWVKNKTVIKNFSKQKEIEEITRIYHLLYNLK